MNTSYWIDRVMNTIYHSSESSFYLGLSSTPVHSDGRGATEPTDRAYSRVLIGGFSDAMNGSVSNSSPIRFPASSEEWFGKNGLCSYYILYDGESSNAHVLGSAALETPIPINTGMSFYIPPGTLRITLFDGDVT